MKNFYVGLLLSALTFSLISCSDSPFNRLKALNNSNVEPEQLNTTYNFDPMYQLNYSSVHKNSHIIDMLPILPLEANQYKPEMNQLKFQKICKNNNSSNLKKVKFIHGKVRTDINTDTNIYYAENINFYYVGDVELDKNLKYMIVFSPEKPMPLIYVKYHNGYPEIIENENSNIQESYIPTSLNSEILTEEEIIEADYKLLTSNKPKCGKKENPEPTSLFTNKEITLYTGFYEGEISIQKNDGNISCVNALQAIHSSLAHLQKRQKKPLKVYPIANKLNAMQGNILRLACNNSSYIVPTSLNQENLEYIGHSVYLAKIIMSVDKNSNVEDLYFSPQVLVPDVELNYPTHKAIRLSSYVSEVTSSVDESLKEVTAYIPINHLIDCKKLYEQVGYNYHANPEKRPLSTQVMHEFDNSTKAIQLAFALGESDEDSAAEKCKGDVPKTSPLIIQLNSEKPISVLNKVVNFDYNLDGKKESILGWPHYSLKNQIGFIIYKDKNHIQLIGNNSKFHKKNNFADGHEALSYFDNDKNGDIDSADKVLDRSLFIWFDKNNNGNVDPNELTTFKKYGITKINVSNIVNQFKDINHSHIAFIDTANKVESTFTKNPITIYDLWFTALE